LGGSFFFRASRKFTWGSRFGLCLLSTGAAFFNDTPEKAGFETSGSGFLCGVIKEIDCNMMHSQLEDGLQSIETGAGIQD
jgi:hypothetical protein